MSELILRSAIALAERALMPDAALRFGIRRICHSRLREEAARARASGSEISDAVLAALTTGPIAENQEHANQQHYEVPPSFFQHVLGPCLKYSCCLWNEGTETLEGAERAMLALTCERAEIADGQQILELGCGWGSLTLWMARHYPQAEILAVSNSDAQRLFIEDLCRDEGLDNVAVRTVDVATLDLATHSPFDRVVSVEMFEHLSNWNALLHRIHSWLEPSGRLFLHYFCHRQHAYLYQRDGAANWMGRTFFTGGLMPSYDLPRRIGCPLEIDQQWRVSGRHYEATCNAWLDRLDSHSEEVRRIFQTVYGDDAAKRWIQRWRLFFMSCAELFGYAHGEEWMLSHLRLAKG